MYERSETVIGLRAYEEVVDLDDLDGSESSEIVLMGDAR